MTMVELLFRVDPPAWWMSARGPGAPCAAGADKVS
jgi:hypothetical protein